MLANEKCFIRKVSFIRNIALLLLQTAAMQTLNEFSAMVIKRCYLSDMASVKPSLFISDI